MHLVASNYLLFIIWHALHMLICSSPTHTHTVAHTICIVICMGDLCETKRPKGDEQCKWAHLQLKGE